MDYSSSDDDSYNDVNFWRVSPMIFIPDDNTIEQTPQQQQPYTTTAAIEGDDDNSLNNSTGDVILVDNQHASTTTSTSSSPIPIDAYQLVITRDLKDKSSLSSSMLLANILNRLTHNYLYLIHDAPKISKVAERAAELRKELIAAQKELDEVSGPYDDYFVQQWKRSVVNQVKGEVEMAELEVDKIGEDKDLLEGDDATIPKEDLKRLTVTREFEVKATASSDGATTATTCDSFINLLATGAYDGGEDGRRDASLPKHKVTFRIVSERVTENGINREIVVPVSGRKVQLYNKEFEISISGKLIKGSHVVWNGSEWRPADSVADGDYYNIAHDDNNEESAAASAAAVEVPFDQGIIMLQYASVLQILNTIASSYHVLDDANDLHPNINTTVALLESLSLGKCQSFPIYYDGAYLARIHVAARHVVHDGPWARQLPEELRARSACLLSCNLMDMIPDDIRCPSTIEGMVDQVKRSTNNSVQSDDLTRSERQLLDLIERSF